MQKMRHIQCQGGNDASVRHKALILLNNLSRGKIALRKLLFKTAHAEKFEPSLKVIA